MCPLRVILIFLSATLAGFFVLRGLRSDPEFDDCDSVPEAADGKSGNRASSTSCKEKIAAGFWTVVDMASGRYLWRNLVSNSSSSSQIATQSQTPADAHEKLQ